MNELTNAAATETTRCSPASKQAPSAATKTNLLGDVLVEESSNAHTDAEAGTASEMP